MASKAERQIMKAEKRAMRARARAGRIEARTRFLFGFAGGYVAGTILPTTLGVSADTVNLGMLAAGGYFGYTDPGDLGDYATGVGAVGTIQSLDSFVVPKIKGLLNKNGTGNGNGG
jgi:hypothetical protein